MKKYVTGDYEERPWGSWEVLSDESLNPGSIIKRIIVKPNCRLSLQYHLHRHENWFISAGTALVTINGREYTSNLHDTFFIRATDHHRVKNIGNDDLIIIEIQHGEMLDEDDITRIEDDYSRN